MVSRSSTRFLDICIAPICKAKHLKRAEIVIIDGTILGVLPDVVPYDTLINAYSRFVSFEVAYSVLDRMKEACINPDVFTCNSLIAGAMRYCLLSKCMDLFEEMLELRIKADVWTTFNTMLKGLCKNGFVENALMLFRNLKRHGFVPLLVTSNILINRLCKARRLKTARGYTFDGFAYCTVVGALVKTCRIEEANHYMERMVNTGIGIEMTSYNAPINLNCKGSKLEVACEILDEMDKV
ncbi:hypothetical protein NC651_034811 [Populus alba x Populus x berolinensis]|nr:hypothetical protein NC651_034811 [Populus alba x Populus x berolinensis]